MPSFKPKTTKKIKVNKKNSITLDGKHKEFLNDFSKDENETIPELKQEKSILKKELIEKAEELTIEQRLDKEDRIREITEEINQIKNKKKEYFLDHSSLIFDYFENKKNISNGMITTSSSNTNTTSKSKLLASFFKIKEPEVKDMEEKTRDHNIVQKYLSSIDETFLDIQSFIHPTDVCKYCFKGELIPLEDEGLLICNQCSRNTQYLIENEKPSYKEPPKEVCFYAYKRINHFKEILAQFQGKETTQIPAEVIENIKAQIKKERIELSQLTNYKTKEILKKLGYNKYYEHIPFIKDKLGIKPPIMSPELEEKLCNLFMELQVPYAKFCPDYRVNFLNYYYILFKLCELLGEKTYLNEIAIISKQ
jgi:hypothetical protein